MSCPCGYADACNGEFATFYPLQDGGMCSVSPCRNQEARPDPDPITRYYEDRTNGAHAAKAP